MSASPDFMSQILQQAGLLNSQPTPQGGLLGALNAQLAPYGGASGLGLSLMANRSGATAPGAALAQGMQDAQQLQLRNQSQQLQNAQGAIQLQQALQGQALYNDYLKRMQQGQSQQQGTQQVQPDQNGAAPAVQGPAPSASGATSSAPTQFGGFQQGDIARIPINGIPVDMYRLMAMRGIVPKMSEPEILAYQTKIAQQQAKPQLDALDTVIKSPYDPAPAIKSNPLLQQAWQTGAKLSGLDPTDLSDPNKVRLGLAAARNTVAGNVQVPPIDPLQRKVEWKDAGDKLFPVYADTGEPVKNLQPIQKHLTPVQQAQGAVSDDAKEFAWQQFKTTHQMPQTGGRGGALQSAAYANYFAMRAKQEGDTGAEIAARGQQFKATQGVLKDFESGNTSKTLNGLNTAISHMDQLDQAATALDNGNVQVLNKLSNFFGTQFGSSKVTNFNIVKNFAAGEVAKAVLPGGGGEREREEIAADVKNASSPAQLHDAIQKWRELLAGKTDALRNQWDVGTNGTQGSFDKFLLPATRKALGISSAPQASAHPTEIQSLLDKYK